MARSLAAGVSHPAVCLVRVTMTGHQGITPAFRDLARRLAKER